MTVPCSIPARRQFAESVVADIAQRHKLIVRDLTGPDRFRASSPKVMMASDAPIGPVNHVHIQNALIYARDNGGKLLAAWGNDGAFEDRNDWFCSRARQHGIGLTCLGTTKGWHPKHPMARGKHRIPRDQQPIVWRDGAGVGV